MSSEKIHLFVRHCYYSTASSHKKRAPGFSHEKCHYNLMDTLDRERVDVTFFLDTHYQKKELHFIQKQKTDPVVEIDAGCEGKSFLALLGYVMKQDLNDEAMLYFLEDDYLHRKGWADILLEGFTLDVDYLTLYDHRDKYFLTPYTSLKSELFYTSSTHWRTTPSTTNTYAMKMKTLKKHFRLHQKFSRNRLISADHKKFLALGRRGAKLISPIPGWSTHAEPEFSSPCFHWDELLI